MAETWLLLQSGDNTAACNMAWDEALLEWAARLGRPLLRFYAWSEKAASFGYAQRFAEAAHATHLRPLVRRPTGGGVVPHAADWTYSLLFPPAHTWAGFSASESYRRAHAWVRDAFALMEVPTLLSHGCRRELPGRCFSGVERFDLLWNGRKIAGAAQRRNRCGLLIQGSVQPPLLPIAKADWQHAMCDVAALDWGVRWEPFAAEAGLVQRAEELVRTKYALAAYNERR